MDSIEQAYLQIILEAQCYRLKIQKEIKLLQNILLMIIEKIFMLKILNN